eukprot:GEZU01004839.1.p1 GENE.GEZU01004839.1~~GEZU01004839.1.p1  ORF type:complete len:220 (+),score=48.83 GEZU01004839.1:49-660(+)
MNQNEFKLVVIGGGGVGKSALTVRYIQDKFLDYYDPTIEDTYRKQDTIHFDSAAEICFLHILDTSGQEEFSALRDQYMRSGQGFLCVYSITERSTFTEIDNYRQQILRVKDVDDGVPMVIVGNKCDLESERQISAIEGQNKAKNWGNIPFFEASAMKNINVSEAYHALTREIRKAMLASAASPIVDSAKDKKDKKKGNKCVVL